MMSTTQPGTTYGRGPEWLTVGARVFWMATEPSHCHGKPNRKRARPALVLAVTARSVKITTPDRWPGNVCWVRRANVEPAPAKLFA